MYKHVYIMQVDRHVLTYIHVNRHVQACIHVLACIHCAYFAGGIGGLVLAIVHKMEISRKLRKVRECGTCCNLLARDDSNVSTHVCMHV